MLTENAYRLLRKALTTVILGKIIKTFRSTFLFLIRIFLAVHSYVQRMSIKVSSWNLKFWN